jgi:4-hydroxy-tetrahydrodipicolinate synthase
MKNLVLKGTMTALITPFQKDGSVDFSALEKLINFQIESGVECLVVCGSTGESATLTIKEKQAIIIKAIEFSAGRVPIIAGTGSNDTQMTMDMTLIAKEYGASAALIVAPYYNKPSQDGLFEHYKIVADRVDIPIILYNVPGRTGVNITAATQLKLANACKNIVATKEASADLEQMMFIIKNAPEHFSLLSGDDALTIPIISVGGKGVISVISNYAPKQFSEMVRLALKGKNKEALAIHYNLLEMMDLNFIETNPVPVKTILSMMGYAKEIFRLPLLPAKADTKKKLKAALQKAQLID